MKLFLGPDKIGELLRLAEPSPRDSALFHVSISTGLRISDILRLKRSQMIDTDGSVVRALRVRMKKTKKYIGRPLREDCRAAVAAYLVTRTDENPYLFPPQSNNQVGALLPMTRSSAHRIYKKYLSKLYPGSLLEGVSTHSLRRSMAKIVSTRAGRIEPASSFLGHRNIVSTMSYLDAGEIEQQADNIVLGELQWEIPLKVY